MPRRPVAQLPANLRRARQSRYHGHALPSSSASPQSRTPCAAPPGSSPGMQIVKICPALTMPQQAMEEDVDVMAEALGSAVAEFQPA